MKPNYWTRERMHKFAPDIDTMSHAQLVEYVERCRRTVLLAVNARYHRHYDAIAERLNEAKIALHRIEDE